MATNDVKSQHFVPRLYLRYFVNSEDRLFAYDKVNNRSFRTTVEGIANETFFYDFPQTEAADAGAEPRVQVVEKMFSDIEGEFAEALRQLHTEIAAGSVSEAVKEQIVPYFALQLLRTRETRNSMHEFQQALRRSVLEVFGEDATFHGASVKEMLSALPREEPNPVAHAEIMFNPEILATTCKILSDHIWIVFRNNTSQPLYTSDHPIGRHAHLSDPYRSTSGINSPGIELVLPLSPTLLLSMSHRESFKRLEAKEYTVIEMQEEHVIFYNDIQVSSSHRQVYCSKDNFELAAEICRDRPYLQDPNRATVQVNIGDRTL